MIFLIVPCETKTLSVLSIFWVLFLEFSSSASTEDACAGLRLAATSWLGDFLLPSSAPVEAPATFTTEVGLLITSCISWPCSYAGDITSRINWYWWTRLATTRRLVLIPGDARPPHPRPERPTRWQISVRAQEANGDGLVPAPPWLPLHTRALFTLHLSLDWQF